MLIEDLQRAAVDVVGAAQPVGCGPTLEQDESDAPARQLGGEHQASRTSADDCHVEFRHFGTVPAKWSHRPILTNCRMAEQQGRRAALPEPGHYRYSYPYAPPGCRPVFEIDVTHRAAAERRHRH